MPWFKVDDGFHAHRKVARLGREDFDAISLWTVAGSWAADQLTDGWVPEYVAARLDPDYERRAKALVRVGLWELAQRDGEPGWLFHGWSEPGRNPTAEQVEREREATAERQRKFRDRVKGTGKPKDPAPEPPAEPASDNGVSNAVTNEGVAPVVTLPVPFPSVPFLSNVEETTFLSPTASPPGDVQTESVAASEAETQSAAAEKAPSKPKKPRKPEPQRDDVDALCNRLAEMMIANGCKPPSVTEEWRREARLMLDRDRREFGKAMALLEWSQHNVFWKRNIHSLPKFREQYDKLRMQATEEWERAHAAVPSQRSSTDTRVSATTRATEHGMDLIRQVAERDGVDLATILPFAPRGELSA